MAATVNFQSFESRSAAAEALVDAISDSIMASLHETDTTGLILSGGSSPKEAYQRLSRMPLDWARVGVSLTDERDVPVDHEDSNARMLQNCLFRYEAAGAVFHDLRQGLPPEVRHQRVACCVVGVGEDGHFASIFPDAEELALLINKDAVPACEGVLTANSPYPRITMNLSALLVADRILLLAFGERKKAIIERPDGYPIAYLLSHAVDVFWAD